MAGNGNSINSKAYSVDEKLVPVVKVTSATRPQVVAKLWDYIRTNRLQDPSDKRTILCDAQMREAFGVQSMTMFEMNKLLSPLLVAL